METCGVDMIMDQEYHLGPGYGPGRHEQLTQPGWDQSGDKEERKVSKMHYCLLFAPHKNRLSNITILKLKNRTN